MEVKKAKIGQHRPKMEPRGSKLLSISDALAHGGGGGELPGGLRIRRIQKSRKV